ncbi:TRAP transporter small permease [Kushneria indalinina]|uniref:TRAP transporter small permease protein n=1 Tax=Kushneria indalinina DSM 14324 TaxID=1122140 RepID=A0A3D9DSE4_9GAMM|nr:TRAP transporter small permease subunit [Kushneria indalinina]REC93688.1 TRAP-type C4-dicarboxylate transport system permease small subunit [Kushneria indalinina DSM 14324]
MAAGTPGAVAGRSPVRVVETLRLALYGVAVTVGAIAFLALFVVIMGAVLARYFDFASGSVMQALPRMLFPWLVCAGFGVAGLSGQHIAMEALTQRVPVPLQRWLAVISSALLLTLYLFLLWQVLRVLQVVGGMNYPLLGISQGWGYGALLMGLGLMLLGATLEGIRVFCTPPTSAEKGSVVPFVHQEESTS